ncbi:MAG: ferredoxin family protein [Bacteroidetes bacterium]|nr:ferredoxin family protein [Bacteroidota bacterium]MCH8941023.1 ferredoxin family protein [Bacteroidota bacterium]
MTYVITKLCVDCKDVACTQVCPVDCIYEYSGDDESIPKNMLLIDPDECIDCNACVPECPWEAIFEEDDVPDIFNDDTELNARIMGVERFVPNRDEDQKLPTPDELNANNEKWGYKP